MTTDWRDGFLFVGNRLSLDFLNTQPILDEGPTELLRDNASLGKWLEAARLVSPARARQLEKRGSGLSELLAFREHLRQTVLQMQSGRRTSRAFIAEVNRLLATHPYIDEVTDSGAGPIRGKRFDPQTPLDVFAPIVDDVATLLALPDKSRIRKCPACVLHFHDTSKKGTRIWCSMNMCGNRSKVAAYAKRNRAF